MSVAKYFPFNGVRGRLRLGLSPIERADWIQYEQNFVARIKDKKKLIKKHGCKVLDGQQGSVASQEELLQTVVAYLHEYKKDLFELESDKITSLQDHVTYHFDDYVSCPLELISYLVADDFCLLENCGDDYKLIAASVCAPTWWELADKMGKPLSAIHAPITGLEQNIGRMIRHFMCNLPVGELYQRSNWFVSSGSVLCMFPDKEKSYQNFNALTLDNIEEYLYLRTERQVFCKLHDSEHIAFSIKVYVDSISIVKQHAAIAEDLLTAMKVMDELQKQATGIDVIEGLLTEYLLQFV